MRFRCCCWRFPGLLALIGASAGWRQAAWRGFWFGFGHHLVGLYWITEAILYEAARYWWLVPLAVPALSAVLALFIALPCAVAWRARPGWRRVAVLAGAWVLADLARQFVGTGFPWNLWGSVWAVPGLVGDIALQPAAWVGVHGLTLATLLLAATPSLGRRAMAAGAAGLLLWAGAGVGPAAPGRAVAAAGADVVLVQGDVAQGQKWDRAFAMRTFERYLALTRTAWPGRRPGGGGVAGNRQPVPAGAGPAARAAIAAAAGGAPALVGSVRFDAAGRPRNSLMALVGAGPPVGV